MPSIDSRAFRQLMGLFATGIVVATTHDPRLGRIGITINSFTSVSLSPPLILFCLDKRAHVFGAFNRAETFAINILADNQKEVSQHFANYRAFPEPKNIWERPHHNCPLLKNTLGWMVCRKTKVYKGGDHSIFLGEAIELKKRKTTKPPLVYFQSHYHGIAD